MKKYAFLLLLAAFAAMIFPAVSAQATCGNHSCESPSENSCTCAADCGSCIDQSDSFFTYSCDGPSNNICTQHPKTGVCGNSVCEAEYQEEYGSCPADCEPESLDIEVISPASTDTFARNQTGLLAVKITSGGREVIGAQVTAVYPYRSVLLQNKPFSNEYEAVIQIPTDTNEGTYQSHLSASFRKITKQLDFPFTVRARLNGTLSAADETVLGSFLSARGTITNGTTPVQIPLRAALETANHTTLFDQSLLTDENGAYDLRFRTSQNDAEGAYTLRIEGEDAYGNILSLTQEVRLVKTATRRALTIQFELEDENSVARGEKITIVARVFDGAMLIPDARVELTDDTGATTLFQTGADGNYPLLYQIPASLDFGPHAFTIRAHKNADVLLEGSAPFSLNIVPSRFGIELLKPQSGIYSVGDAVEFKVYARYDSGEPVLDANVFALLDGYELPLTAQGAGYYGTTYPVPERANSETPIKILATDRYGQTATAQTKLNTFGYSLGYYLSNFGLVAAAVLLVIVGAVLATRYYAGHAANEQALLTRKQQLTELETELQNRYFEKGGMEKTDYEQQMTAYEDELKKINEKMAKKK